MALRTVSRAKPVSLHHAVTSIGSLARGGRSRHSMRSPQTQSGKLDMLGHIGAI